MAGIIDMWAPIVPTAEMVKHIEGNFAKEMLGYLRIFSNIPVNENMFTTYIANFAGGVPLERFVAIMDAAGIERSLITGFDEASSVQSTFVPNRLIAEIAKAYPDRFIPFAGIDIFKGMAAVREVERLIKEEGFRGVSLRPFMIGLPPEDRRYYPIYVKCIELGVPVSIHASANWSQMRTNDLAHPSHFDTVACDLPELRMILSHGGYPWVLEAVMLAWKHPNVYLELAAHRPKYFSLPGTGWEPLLRFGNTVIQDKVLFGTGSFLLGRSPVDIVKEFKTLPLKPEIMEKWLYQNAQAVFDGVLNS
ncbi:MAG: amidohydrolase family protein [Acidobacteriota bacterium]